MNLNGCEHILVLTSHCLKAGCQNPRKCTGKKQKDNQQEKMQEKIGRHHLNTIGDCEASQSPNYTDDTGDENTTVSLVTSKEDN